MEYLWRLNYVSIDDLMPNRFCAICGKKIDKNAPNFSTCLNCYLEENPLFELPEKFNFRVCSDCFSYSKNNDWIKLETENILEIIETATHQFLLKDLKNYEDIDFEIIFDKENFGFSHKDLLNRLEADIIGQSISNPKMYHEESLKININYELCNNCANIRGGTHFVSILQLRVKEESSFNLLEIVLEEIQAFVENLHKEDNRQYISKMVDQKNGVDLYLSTNQLLNYIISNLRGKFHFFIKRSKRLVGRDTQRGKNIYRLKAVLKFLPINKDDVILIDNHQYSVEQILKNKVILKSEDNKKITKRFQDFFDSNFLIMESGE